MHLLLIRTRNLYLPIDLRLKLFDQTILPILTYSCEIWGYENCGLLESIHTQVFRSIIHARKSTPLYMLYGELGRYPINITIKSGMINYWTRIITSKHNKLGFLLYQKLRATTQINSKWILHIQQILEESGRTDTWISETPNPNYGSIIKQNLKDHFFQNWCSQLDQSLNGLNDKKFSKLRIVFPKSTNDSLSKYGKIKNRKPQIPL